MRPASPWAALCRRSWSVDRLSGWRRHGVPIDGKGLVTERLAEVRQGVAEAAAGLFVLTVAPQEAGKLVSRIGPPRRHGEVGKQEAAFPGP